MTQLVVLVLLGMCPAIYGQSPPQLPTNCVIDSNILSAWKSNIVSRVANTNAAPKFKIKVAYISAWPTNMFSMMQCSTDLVTWKDMKCAILDSKWHTNSIWTSDSNEFFRVIYGSTNCYISQIPN